MVKVFFGIYKVLSAHRRWAASGLLLLVVGMLTLALHVSYEEDIARFLPAGEEQQDYQQAIEQLNAQSRIVVCFTGDTHAVKQAMDPFETCFEAVDTAHTVDDLQVTVDETRMLDVWSFVCAHAPYFLTPEDYGRMDSLLAIPDYVASQLLADKQQLLLPTGGMAVQTLAQDPLQLFAPVMGRLRKMGQNSHFVIDDGYIFTNDGRHGLAFLSSPYGVSESARNADLSAMLNEAIARTTHDHPSVAVSAIGGPLIAVGNAAQIKRDSLKAVGISVGLILALLVWHYRRLHDLLWIAASIGFGWLFAVAGMSLLRDSVSIIVLGIGSVIIGIAVNYPLHYLDHLRETGDWGILEEAVPFDNDPALAESLLEHMRRSFRFTETHLGPHGLPLIGRADWNDCLNLNCFSDTPDESFQTFSNPNAPDDRVAESVLIAGMFVAIGPELVTLQKRRGDNAGAQNSQDAIDAMNAAILKDGWDGEWFVRAYDALGHKVGSKECQDGKIFIESQGYCVMAGVGLADGKARLQEAGATYTILLPWDGVYDLFPVSAIPTSFFIDSQGHVIGEPIVGAYVEAYTAALDAAIAETQG